MIQRLESWTSWKYFSLNWILCVGLCLQFCFSMSHFSCGGGVRMGISPTPYWHGRFDGEWAEVSRQFKSGWWPWGSSNCYCCRYCQVLPFVLQSVMEQIRSNWDNIWDVQNACWPSLGRNVRIWNFALRGFTSTPIAMESKLKEGCTSMLEWKGNCGMLGVIILFGFLNRLERLPMGTTLESVAYWKR